MAQNQNQWAIEKAIITIAPSPPKKEASMYEPSSVDHLNAEVDTLFQKFNELSVSVVTPALVLPPCEVC